MKRIFLASAFFCFFSMLVTLQAAEAANGLRAEAMSNLQRAVVKALPEDSNIIRVAILDLDGDDGTIKNALTSIISEKTTFKIIERSDLDKILKEQGLQLKDVIDEKTRIQHGKIRGVQGLLMGDVKSMDRGFMSFTIRAHLKLADVEKGEIVFAKDFNVTAVSPWRTRFFWGVGLFALLLMGLYAIGRRRIVVSERAISRDKDVRVDAGRKISDVIAKFVAARDKLMEKGLAEKAVRLKEAERNLLTLKNAVEDAPRGSSDMRKPRDFKKALAFDKKFGEHINSIAKSVEKLYDAACSGAGDLEQRLDQAKNDIQAASDAFKGRNI